MKNYDIPNLNNYKILEDKMEITHDANIVNDKTKVQLLYDLFQSIEKNSSNFNLIKKHLYKNKELLEEFISNIKQYDDISKYRNQEIYFNSKLALSLSDQFIPVHCESDGNCLFRAIALLLFADQKFYFVVKLLSIYVILSNEFLFKSIIKVNGYAKEVPIEKVICETSRRNEWGNELNIFSISILLDRTILSFVPSKDNRKYVIHDYELKKNNRRPILIGCHDCHFFPILTRDYNVNLDKEIIYLSGFNLTKKEENLFLDISKKEKK